MNLDMLVLFICLLAVLHKCKADDGWSYKRVCYYTNWAQYRPGLAQYNPDNINPRLCTHIIYAFAKVLDNELQKVEWNDDQMFRKVKDIKVLNPGLKTLIAVGGWNAASSEFTKMVESLQNRQKFIASTLTFLRNNSFDGLDLDWEYPTLRGGRPQDKGNLVLLVRELKQAFSKDQYLLTAAVPAGKAQIDSGYDVANLSVNLDFINLMAYDLHGSWDKVTGQNSPLFPSNQDVGDGRQMNMKWAAEYWVLRGVPKHKLVIGMATYGRTFSLTDAGQNGMGALASGPGPAGTYTREDGFLSYNEICSMQDSGHGETRWDDEQKVPYYVNGNLWVGFDNVNSITEKVRWLMVEGYGGAMIWALDLDDFSNVCNTSGRPYPLLSTIFDHLASEHPTSVPSRATSIGVEERTVMTSTTSSTDDDWSYKRVCYYTNWAQYRPGLAQYNPDNINPRLCTHIIYAFAKVLDNQLQKVEWNDDQMFQKIKDIKVSNPGLKTLIAVGGWTAASSEFTKMVESSQNRQEFIESTLSFLRNYGFDGLDLDWEYPTLRGGRPQDKGNLVLLVRELKQAFSKDQYLLTAAVPAGKTQIDSGYDVANLSMNLDFINLMTYDLHGSWDKVTGQNSPLFPSNQDVGDGRQMNMIWAAEYWVLRGVPKHKLVIGMATYGRTFSLTDAGQNGMGALASGPGPAGTYTREDGFLSYNEICSMQDSGHGETKWDEQKVPYYVNGNLWVGFDNVNSISEKVRWLMAEGYGGAMIWALDLDDFRNVCHSSGRPYPLLSTIFDHLTSEYPTSVPSRATSIGVDGITVIMPKSTTMLGLLNIFMIITYCE